MNRANALKTIITWFDERSTRLASDEREALDFLAAELDVLQSAAPDGTVKAAQVWPTNAELIDDVSRLYLRPTDLVVDVTYGYGTFWANGRPDRFVAHDLNPKKGDGVDFRALPEANATVDVLVFDPNYVCVSLDTEILTRRGWQTYDRIRADDYTLTFNMDKGMAEWQPVLAVNVFPATERMVSFEGNGHSSLTTPEHRWPVRARITRNGVRQSGPWTWATSDRYRSDDSVPIAAEVADLPDRATYPDALVEIVAWFWTEGHIEPQRDGSRRGYSQISQSRSNAENCELIRSALTNLFGPPVDSFPRTGRVTDGMPRWRETTDGRNTLWWLSADAARSIQTYAPDRVPTYEFLLSLTDSQLRLFIDRSMRADGCERITADGYHSATLGQKDPAAAEAFQFAAILAGYATTIRPGSTTPYGYRMTTVRLRTERTIRPSRQTRQEIVTGEPVWCPTTPNETWLARRHGTVYFTGNSKGGRKTSTIDDMDDRYEMATTAKDPAENWLVMRAGLVEAHRVLRTGGYLWFKMMNYITGGTYQNVLGSAFEAFAKIGFEMVDMFDHVGGTGPQPLTSPCPACKLMRSKDCPRCDGTGKIDREQRHARNNVSYLLVARKVPPPVEQLGLGV